MGIPGMLCKWKWKGGAGLAGGGSDQNLTTNDPRIWSAAASMNFKHHYCYSSNLMPHMSYAHHSWLQNIPKFDAISKHCISLCNLHSLSSFTLQLLFINNATRIYSWYVPSSMYSQVLREIWVECWNNHALRHFLSYDSHVHCLILNITF